MTKKKVSIFFIPAISGEGFLILALFVILLPFLVLGLITQFLGMTIGPFLEPIIKSYSSLVLLPVIFFIKPDMLATSFGTEVKTEAEIQAFFEKALTNTSQTQYLYMNLIFIGVMLALILLYYYKNGIRKGILGWIGRYFFLNFLITIPLWGFITDMIIDSPDASRYASAYYTEIFAVLQEQVKQAFIILFVIALVVTIIGHALILLTGRNYLQRKQYWAERKREKEMKRIEKLERKKNKEIEYY
ncbi:hypothetical protein [Geosporobacter ferrireducens]|uniref:Uncharacterized protein n=1 Tax=Geosporobacter ferrireducens TaxID=1424294 RepID=A0A1D8GLN0_9FIRM|nr:hypothetical protein [Geosporobacter ferrireducens]AOT71811.1 hypothetical protein Gferi_21105 [Geosporobacter ferrireducens]MTI55594.1 hypothetical protein [Geosporobacter ferrireducens]